MKRLTCGCCGEAAFGKQHWNQDTGFGLCARCVPVIANNPRAGEEELRGYGTAGVNYAKPLSPECQPGMLVSWLRDGEDRPHVGTLVKWVNGKALLREHGMTGEESEAIVKGIEDANARLIAAAPDLLKALDDLLWHTQNSEEKQTAVWFRNARAAIAKATGQ